MQISCRTVYSPKTKHKVIQEIIFKAYDVETLGRGLKRMDTCCKEAGIHWEYQKSPFGFSFTFLRKNMNNVDVNLPQQAMKLLDYMHQNGDILENKEKACSVINRKERATASIIAELMRAHKIERIGSNKTDYWKIVK